jgi:hypothetical protein
MVDRAMLKAILVRFLLQSGLLDINIGKLAAKSSIFYQ